MAGSVDQSASKNFNNAADSYSSGPSCPRVSSLGAQPWKQDDLGRAAQVTVAAGQFGRVGRRRHECIRIPMKVQDFHAGFSQGGQVIDRIELARSTVEFFERQAIVEPLRRSGDDARQGRISAEVRCWAHTPDPIDACRMAKCPTICDQAAVAVGQSPRPLV